MYLAFTVDADGKNIGRSDGGAPIFYGDREYVKQVLAGEAVGEQVLIGKTSGTPALVLAVPISGAEHSPVGVLAIAMTIEAISDRVTKAQLGASVSVFLLDAKGQVVAHQNEVYARERKDLAGHPAFRALRDGGESRTLFADDQAQRYIAHTVATDRGWTPPTIGTWPTGG